MDDSRSSDDIEKELAELASSDDELTEDTLQRKLNEYHAALAGEFRVAAEATEKQNGDVEELARDYARKLVPNAVAQIAWLAEHSTSDSVRLAAYKELIKLAKSEEKDS